MPGLYKSFLLYIAGSGRTGSSLLDVLLDNHSDISGVGEVHRISLQPDSRACSCGSTISKCEYWQDIRERYSRIVSAKNNKLAFVEHPVTKVKTKQRKIPSIAEVILLMGSSKIFSILGNKLPSVKPFYEASCNSWHLYDAITESNKTKWIVDSTKNAVRLKSLFLHRPEYFKVVHLVRDGRAVVASEIRRLDSSINTATIQWLRANRNVMYVMKTIPANQKLFMRYEDLCDCPTKEIGRLLNFINLPYQDVVGDIERHIPHIIPGNPMLYQGVSKIEKDERWKTELKNDEIKIFTKLGGKLNEKFGYTK